MEQPNISPDSESTLLGQLLLPDDISDSYKTLLFDDKTSPEHVPTTPLPFTPKPVPQQTDPIFCDRLIYLKQ